MQKPRVAVFVIAALLVTEFAVAEDKPFPLEARKKVGQKITVEMTVGAAKDQGQD